VVAEVSGVDVGGGCGRGAGGRRRGLLLLWLLGGGHIWWWQLKVGHRGWQLGHGYLGWLLLGSHGEQVPKYGGCW